MLDDSLPMVDAGPIGFPHRRMAESKQRANVMLPQSVHSDLKEIHDEVCRDRAPYWQTVDRALRALESEVSGE